MAGSRVIAGLALAMLAAAAFAHDAKVGDLAIVEPWARATIGQVRNGAVYFTIVNHGIQGDRLVAVATPVAAKAQLHSTAMEEGVMKMRPVAALEIDAKSSTVLEPGGLHVMLMGVEKPLEEGEAFPMTLTFEQAGSVQVEVHVHGIAAMHGTESHGQESHGGQPAED